MYYKLHGIQLDSDCSLPSFEPFLSAEDSALQTAVLKTVNTAFCRKDALYSHKHKGLNVDVFADGWLFSLPGDDSCMLFADKDYLSLTAFYASDEIDRQKLLPLLRTALECAVAVQGLVSLHSACVIYGSDAICFTAASGTGKSTRAESWVRELGAFMLSGDRPQLESGTDGVYACGVPWDGKEQLYINRKAPLFAVCNIRRGEKTQVRKLSPTQARRIFMQQCFIPMWDTQAAVSIMATIARLSKTVPVYNVICGPDEAAARSLKDILFCQNDRISEIDKHMKIKDGFVLRNVAGENIVMPTGENIGKFDGAVILNSVSAFVFDKLSENISKSELLGYMLSEFDVDQARASADLDALLDKFRSYGILEEEF